MSEEDNDLQPHGYHRPEKGTQPWHQYINENFDWIEDDFVAAYGAIRDLQASGNGSLGDVPGVESRPRNVGALIDGSYHDSRTDGVGGYGVVFEAADITIHSVVVDAEEATDQQPIELRHYEDNTTDPTVVDSTTVPLSGGPERVDLGFEVPPEGEGDPDNRYYLCRGAEPSGEEVGLRRRYEDDGDWSAGAFDDYTYDDIDFIKGGHSGDYDNAGEDGWYYFFDWLIGDETTQVASPRSTDVTELYAGASDPAQLHDGVGGRALWLDYEEGWKYRGRSGWTRAAGGAAGGGSGRDGGIEVGSRPLESETGIRVTIPDDYDTLQAAINDTLPLMLNHEYRYILENGYYEDGIVEIPGFLTGPRRTDAGGSSDYGFGRLRIYGRPRDRDDPYNVGAGLDALTVAGVTGNAHVRVESLDFTGYNDRWRRDCAILLSGCQGFTAQGCYFGNSDVSSGSATCIEPRFSSVQIVDCAFGDGVWDEIFRQKHPGFIEARRLEGHVNEHPYHARYGLISVRNDDTSGDSGWNRTDHGMLLHTHGDESDLYGVTGLPDA